MKGQEMDQDETLYRKIKNGDLSAFDVLYERYRIRLYRFIYSYLKNEQEAEDVFQEAFMKVLKTETLDFSEGTFQAWAFEVSRNLCLNRIRSLGRGEKAFEKLVAPSAPATAENLLAGFQTAEQIRTAVQKIPEAQAEVLNLKLLGVPEKDIAKTLQIPIGTVKSRFHKLIELIKQEVKE